MNMSDLAAMAVQKKNAQQTNQFNQNTSGYTANDSPEDSQDLKTPTAENQQTLIENKVRVFPLNLCTIGITNVK